MKIWGDEKFMKLTPPSPNGQSLWIALIAGRQTINIPGLIVSGEAGFAETLGWPVEAFRKAFQEAFALGMVEADWKARVIWVPNAIRHNKPESPNVVKSWKDSWEEIPECPLKNKAYQSLREYLKGLDKAFTEAFDEACAKPFAKALPNQEQEQEQKQEQKQEFISPSEDGTSSIPQGPSASAEVKPAEPQKKSVVSEPFPHTTPRLEFFMAEYFIAKGRKYVVGDYRAEGGAAKRTIQNIPDDKIFRRAVRAYLASTDTRIKENGHPFMWFIHELNRWATKAQGDTYARTEYQSAIE